MLNYSRAHILVFTKIPDLTPFWDSQTTYWDSSRTTTPGALKYSYPEFNGLDLGKPYAVQTAIDSYVDRHYGPGGGSFSLLRAGPSTEGVQAQEGSNVINDWSTRIHVKKYELSGSFSVLIFLGEVPEDPEQWSASPSFVGAHYAFVNSAAGQCDNCRSQADLVVEGFVHLTLAIEEHSDLTSYEPSVVRPYLKDNLSWRILTVRVFHSSYLVSNEWLILTFFDLD
jgi:tyrosinase